MTTYFLKKNPSGLRDLVLALSLANLVFIKVWVALLYGYTGELKSGYFNKQTSLVFAAILLNVVLLTIILWGVKQLVWRSKRPVMIGLAKAVFLLLLLVPLNFFRYYYGFSYLKIISLVANPLTWVALAVLLLVLVRWRHRVTPFAVALVLILSPFVLVTFAKSVWFLKYGIAPARPDEIAPALPRFVAQTNRPRVVWILFDGLDQRLTFTKRPATINLPEFDRFRSQALFAEQAVSPADNTALSVPALTTGRLVTNAVAVNQNELMLTFPGATNMVGWSRLPNVFSRAREAGFNTAVVGWYHPYSRVLRDSLTESSWQSYPQYEAMGGSTIPDAMLTQVRACVVPFHEMWLHRRNYRTLLRDAKRCVADPGLGLVLCHLPVPHLPGIYNRATGRLAPNPGTKAEQYLGNLVLSDRTFGELRRTMESAGMWERSTVLVTSDHWWVESAAYDGIVDPHVPFLLKLAGHGRPLVYRHPFNTVLLHDLFLAILRGEIATPEQAETWIDRHRGDVK